MSDNSDLNRKIKSKNVAYGMCVQGKGRECL